MGRSPDRKTEGFLASAQPMLMWVAPDLLACSFALALFCMLCH